MSHPAGSPAVAVRPLPHILAAPVTQEQESAALTAHVAHQYDDFQLLLERIGIEAKYLNYGYTRARGESLEQRQQQLCLEVFRAADIRPDDTLVDVGFGSGEQDFLLARTHLFRQLHGFNIAARQVRFATARAQRETLTNKLVFTESEAEHMKGIADGSVDRVLSIECAFYFQRARFYREAARVLKPGGLLVLADIAFHDVLRGATGCVEDLRRVGSISENRSAWERYFATRALRSIRAFTAPGAQLAVFTLVAKALMHFRLKDRRAWVTWLKMAFTTQLAVLGFRTGLIRYDLIVLEKRA